MRRTGALAKKQLRRGVHQSIQELELTIDGHPNIIYNYSEPLKWVVIVYNRSYLLKTI